MVDKMKGLGNSILGERNAKKLEVTLRRPNTGRFGLSTDNFKFEPNGQGGYSLNFSQE